MADRWAVYVTVHPMPYPSGFAKRWYAARRKGPGGRGLLLPGACQEPSFRQGLGFLLTCCLLRLAQYSCSLGASSYIIIATQRDPAVELPPH